MRCGYIVESCGSELLQGDLAATISSTFAANTLASSLGQAIQLSPAFSFYRFRRATMSDSSGNSVNEAPFFPVSMKRLGIGLLFPCAVQTRPDSC